MQVPVSAPSSGSVRAVVTRANGDVVDLGVISKTARTRLGRIWWSLVGSRLAARRIGKFNRENARLA